ncbi:MAG TPA: ElyC/SanA/YdcF family protein [Bryobacteraceae bacterium]|jgi:hypothetical protein|nr:ElyC/SanA/YdcF family protein [Bryobacteraceae bacterium]
MNGGLLMLAGHAIYQGGVWYGGHQNEDRLYETHVRDAFRIYAEEGYQALALSGGRSRPQLADMVSNSEAEGMWEYARAAALVRDPAAVLLEQFGRDSFENLFFAMLCFHRKFGEWPSRVGAVSWKFKALRFYLIACGLRLAEGRFRFFGSGDPAGQPAIEAFAAASVQYDAMIVRAGEIVDPLHRDGEWFAAKRLGRMPREFGTNGDYLRRVKQEYGQAELIDLVESIEPGPGWRDLKWPW